MKEEAKVPLLLFSGGLDSSYMLQTYLEQGNVETVYVKGLIGEEKIAKELAARRKIIKVLQEKTGHYVLRDHVVDIGNIFNGSMPDQGFAQPPMWIVGALQVSDHTKHSHLAIGYVSGDQVACMIPYIVATWDNLQYFAKGGRIPVEFPLQLKRKTDILCQIWPQVVQHVWVCELPVWWRNGKRLYYYDGAGGQIKACGKCAACVTSAGTMAMFEKLYDVKYFTWFIKQLREQKELGVDTGTITQEETEDGSQEIR